MRTRIVWGAFAASMLAFGLVFLRGEWAGTPQMVRITTYSDVSSQPHARADGVLPRNAAIESNRWESIVIHHSGHPLDDHASIAQRHRARLGYSKLGFHFVIGNGSKSLGDGETFPSERWDRQLDGAHVVASSLANNSSAIGICLVGNGNHRSFTPSQLDRLCAVVSRLQRTFAIPNDRVFLASDVFKTTSPGAVFPTLEFEQRLALEN